MNIQRHLQREIFAGRPFKFAFLFAPARIGQLCLAVSIALSALLCSSNRLELHAQSACSDPYLVRAGDSWTSIAKKCGVSFPDLRNTNPKLWQQRGSNIRPGDTMALPVADGAPQLPFEAVPIATLRAFYAALEQGLHRNDDFGPAYAHLSSVRQASQPLANFQNAYAKTTHVEILHIKLIEQQATTAKVGVIVVTIDLEQDQRKHHQYDVIYPLALEAGVWRIGKTAKYDEIGLLSQGALQHWFSDDISQSLEVKGEVAIWHSNTLPADQGSITYQFTLFSPKLTLSKVEIKVALVDGNQQPLAEQMLTLDHLGGTSADWYQIGLIHLSNQLKVHHFQIISATAEVDGNRVAILATLYPTLFQPLPIVTDSGMQ